MWSFIQQWGWVFPLLAIIYFAHRREKRWERRFDAWTEDVAHGDDVKAIVKPIADTIVASVADRIADTVDKAQQRKVATLQKEIRRLRDARTWVRIAVIVHGHSCTGRLKQAVYAPVLFNTSTGEMKAPPLDGCIVTDSPAYFVHETGNALKTQLGAPSWKYYDDSRESIVMLGVVYGYRDRKDVRAVA